MKDMNSLAHTTWNCKYHIVTVKDAAKWAEAHATTVAVGAGFSSGIAAELMGKVVEKIIPDLPESKWSTVSSKMHTWIGDDGNKKFWNMPERMKRVKDVKNLALNAGKSFTYGPGIGVAADAAVFYGTNNGSLDGFNLKASAFNNVAVSAIGAGAGIALAATGAPALLVAGVGIGIGVGFSVLNSRTGWSFSKEIGLE
ncbi:hypothetical protein LC087_12710 [Bacillus carboniphilus]|uniref:Uncharacterized protein n=1 Tax=Bacillus carboniphilus TaxID=86663 RepID=A0ABY9JVQ3_9BACI|nr:hypothetical protein [Bacillus carboniphilus]WLR41720.1 hypothetical protein LC087_12710 [Bacillus carboniphilus]